MRTRRPLHKLITVAFLLLIAAPLQAAPVWVDTAWLAKRLNDPKLVLVDMSSDDTQYQRFHLPGAVRLPFYALMQHKKGAKFPTGIPEERFLQILGMLGIGKDDYVVIYDDMGGLNAGRLFWYLERVGHKQVSVLDGGLVKWILEGRKVVNTPVRPKPVKYGPAAKGRDNEVDLGAVKKISQKGGAVLLDVRSPEEYVGDLKKRRGGHVPGAYLWPWNETVDFSKGFVRKPAAVLEQSLAKLKLTDKKQPVVTYCRSGHRASQAYLVLRGLGFENVKVYSNSMNEYGLDKTAPLKQGRAP